MREEGRRAKVKREDDWLQGKRSISTGRKAVTVKLGRKAAQHITSPLPGVFIPSFPLCFASELAVNIWSEKDALSACLGML